MIRKRFGFYTNLQMRYKLFIHYSLFISIPLTIFIILNNNVASGDLKEQALFSSRQVFEQGRINLEYKFESMNTYMTVVSLNATIQSTLKKELDIYENDLGTWGYDLREMRKQFFITRPSEDITNTTLYSDSAITAIDETEDFKKMSNVVDTSWYRHMQTGQYAYEWFNEGAAGSAVVSGARRILDDESLRSAIGLIRLDIPEHVFTLVLDRVAFFHSSSVFLMSSNHELLASSSNANKAYSSLVESLTNNLTIERLINGIWEEHTFQNNRYLVGIQSVSGSNAHLIVLVPYSEILASQSKAIRQMLLITLIIAPLTFPLAFIVASSGTRRIRKLISQMKTVKQGDFTVRIHPGGKDEIDELTHNFNTMVTKTAHLLDEKYEMGKEIKSMELKALQAQINPHFLYNTLDLLSWKAIRINENSIYELVQSLSTFYKLSLSKGSSIVTLNNEIEHIQAYVKIQNARFKNGLHLLIDVPESLLQCKLPKITLQPIIENAIIHGILETADKKGTIEITAYTKDDHVIVRIADDGVGMSEERAASILLYDNSDTTHGYGVKNIDTRIKLLYGEQYGLNYESRQGNGTIVIITLPTLYELT
ncbi:MAG: sensor histidine kinase [Paenibacillaceae bacterium]